MSTNQSTLVWLPCLLALAFPVLVGMPVRAATPFSLETVDGAARRVGFYTSLALDAQGNPHISYSDFTDPNLNYAVKTGGNWSIEIAAATGTIAGTSLAFDAQDNPHISYSDGDLMYTVKTGGSWSTQTVDAAAGTVQYNSIALDAEGNPHIGYNESGVGLKYAVKTGGTWSVETVDAGNVGVNGISVALDDQGNPHISYGNASADQKYAVKMGGSWSLETVDAAGSFGHSSLALDSQGNPHISYKGAPGLKYAVKTGESWSFEAVDDSGTVQYTSLALDSQGNPHISYWETTDDDLKYAVKTGGSWSTATVDSTGEVGKNSSLALDSQGNPHISYYDDTDDDLKYADASFVLTSPVGGESWSSAGRARVTWEGLGLVDIEASPDGGATYTTLARDVEGGSAVVSVPAWTTTTARVRITRTDPFAISESPDVFAVVLRKAGAWWSTTVDGVGDVGKYTSLELDPQGNPHISYQEFVQEDLRYAVKKGGSWSIEMVDSTGSVGEYTSLALDAQGNPHISYQDGTNGILKYAVKTGATWSTETVDASGIVGRFSSLVLDNQGNPHISYLADSGLDLKYAVKNGGSWSMEIVDATGSVGWYSSLALDATGNPHIAYADHTNFELKYAVKVGTWSTETADALGSFVGDVSLALDAQGNPHIGYYHVSNQDLQYAAKVGGGWSIETVDEAGRVGEYPSLAIDGQSNSHISYLDYTNRDVKYAVRIGSTWSVDVARSTGDVGFYTSLALDGQGNPHISYFDNGNRELDYASAAVEIAAPAGGDVWPVGAWRPITWDGVGIVDVLLSVDGGATYPVALASGVGGGRHDVLVPHTPSRFCQIKLERRVEANTFGTRCYPFSTSASDSFFTIETTVELLAMKASAPSDGQGLVVSWETDPGPEDLDGYRLEKNREGGWLRLVSRTSATEYHDPDGMSGDRYRLFVVNGLGDELYLGETGAGDARLQRGRVLAYPLPYRSGDLTILFGINRLNGAPLETKVTVYDVSGRQVRTLADRRFSDAVGRVTWDGRDERGAGVSSGVYFVRVQDRLDQSIQRILVVR